MKLKVLFFIVSSSVICHLTNAQDYFNLIPEDILNTLKEASKCAENRDNDCHKQYHHALNLAKAQNGCTGCVTVEMARHYINEGLLDSASHYLNKTNKYVEGIKNKTPDILALHAEYYTLVAMQHYIRGNMTSAMGNLLICAQLREEFGNFRNSAYVKMNVANIYQSLGNYEVALNYNMEAETVLKDYKDHRYASLAGNIATLYYDLKQNDSALVWGKKAIRLGEEFEAINPKIYGNYVIASVLENRKNDSAFFYIENAISLSKKAQSTRMLAASLSVYGQILQDHNRNEEALQYFEEALSIYNDLEEYLEAVNLYKIIGETLKALANYEKSSEYFQQYIKLKDSLLSEENRTITQELNTRYETEKKERLIAEKQLNLEKQENKTKNILFSGIILILIILGLFTYVRIKQKNKLKQLEQEKQNAVLNSFINGEERERVRISQELHDGLAALLSAAKMSLEAIPHLDETAKAQQIDKTKTILTNTHEEIRQIAHNLMPFTLEKDGLIAATQQFVTDLNNTGIIQLEFNNQTSKTPELQSQIQLMLYRIIQELVNNIIKHSQATKATVTFSHDPDNKLIIEVTDNGVGFDNETNISHQGLYSIEQRLKAIGGSFILKRNKSTGMQAIAKV